MKFGLLQNLVIGGVVTALGIFSINTIATFAQVPEDSSDRPNIQMNRNSGQMQPMMQMMQPMMQMMQDMTPEQSQAMIDCMERMHSGDGEQMNNTSLQ